MVVAGSVEGVYWLPVVLVVVRAVLVVYVVLTHQVLQLAVAPVSVVLLHLNQ